MAETSMKPCPFCESKNVQVVLFDTPHLERWHRVECQTCMSKSPGSKYVALSIAAWNRRATDPAVAELVEALRRALPSVQSDAEMMDAIDRHNPLPAADMPAVTKAANELDVLVDDIRALLAKHAGKP